MTRSWTLEVDRRRLDRTELVEGAVPAPGDGEALLRVDRVGMTANNVTYALLGDAFRYWRFFPARPGWGVVPLWGFAEVVASRADGVPVGGRVYGYLPAASHLVVRPARADPRGFRDAAEHRADLPGTYNVYVLTTGDPVYEAGREDLLVLFRPLFFTSFVLADRLGDAEADPAAAGARVVVLSSASSKTAYGTAFLLREAGRAVVGLTSAANVAFTEGLGCYDRVLPYSGLAGLDPAVPTAYVDVAGDEALRARLRAHLGDGLVAEAIVGAAHQDRAGAAAFTTPGSPVFFAPDQMRKRARDWGRDGLDARFAEAWRRFAPVAERRVDVVAGHGPEALRDVWLEVLSGRTAPRTGHVLTL